MKEWYFRFQVGPCIVQEIADKLNHCIAIDAKAGTECVYGTIPAAALVTDCAELELAKLVKLYVGFTPEFLILRLQELTTTENVV